MKTICPSARLLPSIACLAALFAFNGCNQKPEADSNAPASSPAKTNATEKAASAAKIVSAEKNSFNDVTSQLDAGGNFYLYLSTEQWLSGISSKVSGLKELVAGAPDIKDENRENVEKAFGVLTHVIKDSGIEDVSGVGISSIAREPGVYHSKAILHHYAGQGSGFLWNMFGQKPHALNGLDLLPTNTVMATFSDFDLPLLWSVIQNEAKQSGLPQAEEFLNKLPKNFEKGTGVKWEQLLSSLGGEFGFAITFDETRRIPIPLPTEEPLEIPEPALMIVIKVNDNTIFDRVEKALKEMQQQVVDVDEAGLKMRTIAVPLPLPIQLRPTIAASGGYLFIATTDQLIRHALAVKAGKEPGLKSTDEFKRLATDLPDQGNQFLFLSQRLGQTIIEVQRQALAASKDAPPGVKKVLQSWLGPDRASFSYSVATHTGTGWVAVGNGNQGAGQVAMAAAIVAPVGLLSAIAIPNFVKARDTARKNACINNLRQIDGAKQQWALENKKDSTAIPTESELATYLAKEKMPKCPAGGSYSINAVSEQPECSHAGHALPNPAGN